VLLKVEWMVVVTTLPLPLPLPLPPPRVMVATRSVVTSLTEAEVVVLAADRAAVSEAVRVEPTMPPVEATDWMLEEIDSAAVTGQMVVARTMVSVTSTVERASAGRVERWEASAGQSVMVAAQEVMVRTEVVRTVRVVRPPAAAVVLFASANTSVATAVPEGAALPSAVMAAVEFWRRKWKCLWLGV
jgi:hypothetical protein